MKNKDLDAAAKALGRLPSGLALICYKNENAPRGFLASWIQQASFHPLRITIAIAKDRGAHPALIQAGALFSLNLLDKESSHLMKNFFGKDDPFSRVTWKESHGTAVLPECLATLICETVNTFDAGDHDLILADITTGILEREGPALVHSRGTALNY